MNKDFILRCQELLCRIDVRYPYADKILLNHLKQLKDKDMNDFEYY